VQWSELPQKQEGQYPPQTSAERKETLYLDIINYFDKGKVRYIEEPQKERTILWTF